ncbi:hypothetical protein J3F84DRAFT_373609 [Trichoderma pleuroticola]
MLLLLLLPSPYAYQLPQPRQQSLRFSYQPLLLVNPDASPSLVWDAPNSTSRPPFSLYSRPLSGFFCAREPRILPKAGSCSPTSHIPSHPIPPQKRNRLGKHKRNLLPLPFSLSPSLSFFFPSCANLLPLRPALVAARTAYSKYLLLAALLHDGALNHPFCCMHAAICTLAKEGSDEDGGHFIYSYMPSTQH